MPLACKHHGQGVGARAQVWTRRGQGLYLVGFGLLLVGFFDFSYASEEVTTKCESTSSTCTRIKLCGHCKWYILNMMLRGEMRTEGRKMPDKKIVLGFG